MSLAELRSTRRLTRGKRLPTAVVCGAAKCGTTTLGEALAQHDDIFVRYSAEFFSQSFEAGKRAYTLVFHGQGDERVIVDRASGYFRDPVVPPRLMSYLGSQVRLIMMFRNPVHRSISHYRMAVRQGREREPFEAAILRDNEPLNRQYVQGGFYATQLRRWLNLFQKSQMFFFVQELDFGDYWLDSMRRLCSFLEVDDAAIQQVHANGGTGPVPEVDESALFTRYFREETAQLEELIDRDLSIWRYE